MKKLNQMISKNSMLNNALEYLDQGFSVIPVKQADKKPYLSTWKEFQTRHPTEGEVERWWTAWPNANIAIITGKISGVFVVDADGPLGIQWMTNNLPKTTVYVHTAKGLHAYYLIPADALIKNLVRLAPEVDIRGEGGYIVAPPSVHQSGHVYRWVFLLDGWDDLAEYKPPSGKTASGNLNIDLSKNVASTSPIMTPVSIGERNNKLAQLAGRWIGMGHDDSEVQALAKAWNAKNNPPLGEKELMKTLWSIRKIDTENNPVIEFVECKNLEPVKSGEHKTKIPRTILSPGGLLQDIMEYIDASSAASVPYFSLAAAITLVGNILGHRVKTETDLRTNMYTITLGYSGSGKSAPIGGVKQILLRSNAANTVGITELTSAPAIFKELSLENKRVTLMLLDEIGLVLSGLKNPNSPAREVPRLLMKFFSNTTGLERKSFAANDDILVPYSHLSLYGTSTPDRFYESISGDELTDGFLARILLFESLHDAPYPKTDIKMDVPKQIIDQVNALHPPIIFDTIDGNLMGRKPKPKVIKMLPEAADRHEILSRKYHNLKNKTKADGFGKATIYGRAAEHAAKLAVIHTMSLYGPKGNSIGLPSIAWAWTLVEYIIENMIVNVKSNVAETLFEKKRNRILKAMRVMGKQEKYKDELTVRDLMRGPCRGMTAKEVKEILNTLLIAGEIGVHEEIAENNHKVIRYFLAKEE